MLDVFEVPGTAIKREPRQIHFPAPEIDSLHSFLDHPSLALPRTLRIQRPNLRSSRPVMDPAGKIRGVRTSVKPIHAPRPPYPRFAREQGWEGTIVLRVTIDDHGKVLTTTIQKSSGHSSLDDSAVQTVKQWEFLPGKNGEFAVSSVVDIPIHFDLKQSH